MSVPPFHSVGEDNGNFYAVAFVPGFYVTPSGKSRDTAFFVLRFSPSQNYTRFSVSTVSPTGNLFHYSRGDEVLDSAEYTMLQAERAERVPLHAWQFFPSAAIDAAAFPDKCARLAYEAARRRVAHIIFNARFYLWGQTQYPPCPLFQVDETVTPEPMASTPEFEDITQCMTDDPAA